MPGSEKIVSDTIAELVAKGYRVTSRRYGICARIDREDWKEFCEKKGYPVCADWYRRVLSKDKIRVSLGAIRRIPNSKDDRGVVNGKETINVY